MSISGCKPRIHCDMTRKVLSYGLLVITTLQLILQTHTSARAAAQPANSSWPMRSHDAQHSGRSAYNGPGGLGQAVGLKWTTATTIPLLASPRTGETSVPVVGPDGIVYAVLGDGKLYALDPVSATPIWNFSTVLSTTYNDSTINNLKFLHRR